MSYTTAADELALERFEQLVLSQKPAETQWEPVTPYDYESRKAIEGQHPDLIIEAFTPKRVLDYGAGYGHLVRLLRERGVKAWGYEPYIEPPKEVERWSRWVFEDDDERYDLVICREVLEHCTILQIRRAVATLCALSSRYVYATTRLNDDATHMLDVKTSDDLDPTHISMLSRPMLRALFVLEGFRRRHDLEQRMDWRQLGRVFVYERADVRV